MENNNIDDFVKKTLEGDLESYRKVIESFEPRVRVVIASMVPDSSLVDDLTQEVFIIAYQKLSTYKPDTQMGSWLAQIARNVAQNERRRWYRKNDMKERYRAEIEKRIEVDIDRMAGSLRGDVLDALQQCIKLLNETAHKMIDGFYFKEMAVKELADNFSMTAGAVRVILCRARQSIAECLQRKGSLSNG
ncbi:MAG: sigma-70 family RNA polymerase sigma factor [Kiritimatiellae bacterium]|nr:sigma-70 family RNA polymerase sigma factor [Kiritimatiellia bacterium]MDD5522618.1 sigma-70 family RNA polymerase sigma factor [Kiritimatiellia bacterium]